ncbi:MAG: pantoate--beta-alanine ligase [Proteobacteria bacterium]|nr:pantoate--beta-alanine ligase [Pseudomonadota bacterium]MDE3207994.1 pantoate--beta-alanine ligase [Pseudomonadota bacterium]
MQVIRDLLELEQYVQAGDSIALVPTLGNLHEGHMALIKQARNEARRVLVSIFVNPLQFGAGEDFERYPRTEKADLMRLEQSGADAVFLPDVKLLYPVRQTVMVEPSPVAADLCGRTRPDHFKGVATVVLKLFNLVRPQVALFGKKDYQQLFIIREMVEQLNVPVRIKGVDTVRDSNGLALSSRNGYLDESDRLAASFLYATLQEIIRVVSSRTVVFGDACEIAAEKMRLKGWKVEYVTIRDANTLQAPTPSSNFLVVLAAVVIGQTRLIDNLEFFLDKD